MGLISNLVKPSLYHLKSTPTGKKYGFMEGIYGYNDATKEIIIEDVKKTKDFQLQP